MESTPKTDEAVEAAARWILENEHRQDLVPFIKTRFGLTNLQACEASALANKHRLVRRAQG